MTIERIGLGMLTVVLVIMMIVMGKIYADQAAEPTLVSFHLTQTVKIFTKEVAGQTNLSAKAKRIEVQRFSSALESALSDYAAKNNVIIFVSPAVIAGMKDATPELQAKIAKVMHAPSAPQTNESLARSAK